MMYVDHSGSEHKRDFSVMITGVIPIHLSTILTFKLEHTEINAATKYARYVKKNLWP